MRDRSRAATERVDRLTRAAHALVQDAILIRTTLPPRWRFRERRAAKRQYKANLDAAQALVEQAKGPTPPPTRNTGKRSC